MVSFTPQVKRARLMELEKKTAPLAMKTPKQTRKRDAFSRDIELTTIEEE
jgi:hypothetical protein